MSLMKRNPPGLKWFKVFADFKGTVGVNIQAVNKEDAECEAQELFGSGRSSIIKNSDDVVVKYFADSIEVQADSRR